MSTIYRPVFRMLSLSKYVESISKNSNHTAILFATMLAIAPTIGATNEHLLQDTLKSMVVTFFVLATCFFTLLPHVERGGSLKIHTLVFFPGLLLLHAVGSIFFSHTYLASVEAIRWFLFCIIFITSLNSLKVSHITWIAWGVHLGAVVASFWAALQFWFDFQLFAQGPNPASTFVNRNFFAEYLICTLPFSFLLAIQLKEKKTVFATAFAICFNIIALMMTGTRSALLALCILVPVLFIFVWLVKDKVTSRNWQLKHLLILFIFIIATLAGLGSINTRNPKLISESSHTTAIGRALDRTLSLTRPDEYRRESISMRKNMWQATAKMIAANPTFGVGAGAWEVYSPLYQAVGSQIETDYYAHNEFLQLIGEAGLVGWLALFGLTLYLSTATVATFTASGAVASREKPLRLFVLASLLALMIVSNAGFPWRLATTGALFAFSLSILAGSDLRAAAHNARARSWVIDASPRTVRVALAGTLVSFGIAIVASVAAVRCESKITEAIKIAVSIARSSNPNSPLWDPAKNKALTLIREGIEINSHYRKLTPIVADAFASWGDWGNATWIWKSVLDSRPFVVVMLTNVARGYLQIGDISMAQEFLNRARAIQPSAISVRSLEVLFYKSTGNLLEAAQLASTLLKNGIVDRELVQSAYDLGNLTGDKELSILAMKVGIHAWPNRAVDGWLRLGDLYASESTEINSNAAECYRSALALATNEHRSWVIARIPPRYLASVSKDP